MTTVCNLAVISRLHLSIRISWPWGLTSDHLTFEAYRCFLREIKLLLHSPRLKFVRLSVISSSMTKSGYEKRKRNALRRCLNSQATEQRSRLMQDCLKSAPETRKSPFAAGGEVERRYGGTASWLKEADRTGVCVSVFGWHVSQQTGEVWRQVRWCTAVQLHS